MRDASATIWAVLLIVAGVVLLAYGVYLLWRNRNRPEQRSLVLGVFAALLGVLLLRSSFSIGVRVTAEGSEPVSMEPTPTAVYKAP